MERQIAAAAALLQQSHQVVALTGAGLSTPSGIPDFRSPRIWEHVDPMVVASLAAFRRHPQAFFDWVRPLTHTILTAQPNPAHLALAQLECYGPLKAIITQNIDMLHTRAGSKIVYEVHGHLREATCILCGFFCLAESLLTQVVKEKTIQLCPQCGGVMKPRPRPAISCWSLVHRWKWPPSVICLIWPNETAPGSSSSITAKPTWIVWPMLLFTATSPTYCPNWRDHFYRSNHYLCREHPR